MADEEASASSDFIEPGSDETSLEPRPMGVSSDYGSLLQNESLLGSVTSSVYANNIVQGRYVGLAEPPSRPARAR